MPTTPLSFRAGRVALATILLASTAGAQEDWPQWRGSDGMAWSRGYALPAEIGPDSPELAWRVAVPGEGNSSPIVAGGRVFLTTAYSAEESTLTALVRSAVPILSVVAVGLSLFARRRRGEDELRGIGRLVAPFDRIAVLLGTLAFAAAAQVATFWPERLWEAGSPGYRWFYTGAIALVGTAVAFGWFRPGSALRLVGAAVVALLALLLFDHIPPNKFANAFALEVRLAMVVPGLAIAGWYVLARFVAGGAAARGSLAGNALGASALVLVAGCVFAFQNVLAPLVGMVRAVLCYDLASGELLWERRLFVAPEETKYPKNSFATPTPCIVGEALFVDFGSGYVCLGLDGHVRWQHVNEQYHEFTRYGASTSPVPFEDTVILLHDAESAKGPSYVMGIDVATGEVRWREEYDQNMDSYSTPLLVERDGETQLVTSGFKRVIGYDPRSGKELWSFATRIGQMVPSIQARGDLLLVSGGTHGDVDTLGLRLSGHGAETQVEKLWSTRRAVPAISSPVWIDDLFVNITDGGIATCYDPESGEIHWQERLEGAFWASLVAGDGKVYALNDEGGTVVLRASAEFEVLYRGDFDSTCHATPALAGGNVLLRTASDLYCFRAAQR